MLARTILNARLAFAQVANLRDRKNYCSRSRRAARSGAIESECHVESKGIGSAGRRSARIVSLRLEEEESLAFVHTKRIPSVIDGTVRVVIPDIVPLLCARVECRCDYEHESAIRFYDSGCIWICAFLGLVSHHIKRCNL